jgi:hypothetical protein
MFLRTPKMRTGTEYFLWRSQIIDAINYRYQYERTAATANGRTLLARWSLEQKGCIQKNITRISPEFNVVRGSPQTHLDLGLPFLSVATLYA